MPVSKRLRYEILRRDNFACRYCGAAAPDAKLNADHVIPQALGGSDAPTNLVASCADCNAGKTSSMPNAMPVADVDQETFRMGAAMKQDAEQKRAALCTHLHMTWAWAWERTSGKAPGETDTCDFLEELAEILDRDISAHFDLTKAAFDCGSDYGSDLTNHLPDRYLTSEERVARVPPSIEEVERLGGAYAAWWEGWEKRDRVGATAKQDRTFGRQLRQAGAAGYEREEITNAAYKAGLNMSPELLAYLPSRQVEGGGV